MVQTVFALSNFARTCEQWSEVSKHPEFHKLSHPKLSNSQCGSGFEQTSARWRIHLRANTKEEHLQEKLL